MKIFDVYNKFWDKPLTSFSDYDRNGVLPYFFPVVTSPVSVLDLGCGDGAVSEWLSRRGYLVTALDFNESALAKARSRGLSSVLLGDLEQPLPFENGSFDFVFWGDVIEHVFDVEGALREIRRILKTEGKLVLSCPNVSYWKFRVCYFLKGEIASIDTVFEEPWERQHIRFLNTKDVARLLCKNGLQVNKVLGVNRIWYARFLVKIFPAVFGYIQVVQATKI
jgi:methionine biosynthesis protein MetW